jgi:hypothetical protein
MNNKCFHCITVNPLSKYHHKYHHKGASHVPFDGSHDTKPHQDSLDTGIGYLQTSRVNVSGSNASKSHTPGLPPFVPPGMLPPHTEVSASTAAQSPLDYSRYVYLPFIYPCSHPLNKDESIYFVN